MISRHLTTLVLMSKNDTNLQYTYHTKPIGFFFKRFHSPFSIIQCLICNILQKIKTQKYERNDFQSFTVLILDKQTQLGKNRNTAHNDVVENRICRVEDFFKGYKDLVTRTYKSYFNLYSSYNQLG